MTTRQHLIEQDCLDKLGWDMSRIASASDKEMRTALVEFELSLHNPVTMPETPPPSPHQKEMSRSLSPPTHHHNAVTDIRARKKQIGTKRRYINAVDSLSDDIELFRASIRADETVLQQELECVQGQIHDHNNTIQKKRNVQNMIMSFIASGTSSDDDRHHLEKTTRQIEQLQHLVSELVSICDE